MSPDDNKYRQHIYTSACKKSYRVQGVVARHVVTSLDPESESLTLLWFSTHLLVSTNQERQPHFSAMAESAYRPESDEYAHGMTTNPIGYWQLELVRRGLRNKRHGILPFPPSHAPTPDVEQESQSNVAQELPALKPILQPAGGVPSSLRIAWKADTAFTSRRPSIYRPEAHQRVFRVQKPAEAPHNKRKSAELGHKLTRSSKRIRVRMSAPKSPHIQYQLGGEGAKRPSLISHHSSGSREQLSSSAQKPRAHVVGKRNKSSGHLARLGRAHSSKNLAAKGLKMTAGTKLNRTTSHVKFRAEEGTAHAVDWEEDGTAEGAAPPEKEDSDKDNNEDEADNVEEKVQSIQQRSAIPPAVSTEISREATPHPSEPDDPAIPEAMSSADQTAPGTPLEQSQISLPAAAPRNMTRTQWKNALERQHTMTFTEPRQRPSGVSQSLNHMGEPDPRIDPISGKVIVRVAVKEAKKDFDAARRVTGRNPVGEAVAALTAAGMYEPRPKSRSWISPTPPATAPSSSTARRGGLFARSEQKGKATVKPLSPEEMERRKQFVVAMKGDLGERLRDLWTHPRSTE